MNNFINSIVNFFEFKISFIALGFLIILFYYYIYFLIKKRLNIKEGMERSPAYGVRLCQDNRCMPGCIKPRFLSNNCESSIYKNPDGKCFMKCPYECQSPLDKCEYNDCCRGCGKTKIEVPCVGFRTNIDFSPGINIDRTTNLIDTPEIVYNNDDDDGDDDKNDKNDKNNDNNSPTQNVDKVISNNYGNNAKKLHLMMNDLNNIYDMNDEYKMRNPKNMKCSVNITNTFTECGLPAANSCL